MGLYRMHFDVQGDLLDRARACEAEVFLQWFGNTTDQLAHEYGPYEDASVFLAIEAPDGEVDAAVRLLVPGGRAGLKTLTDIGTTPWGVDGARAARAAGLDLDTTWEIATLGVRRGRASASRLSLALYHGLIAVHRANGMSAFVAVLDERVRRLLASVGLGTTPLPGTSTAHYLGSDASTPVYTQCVPTLARQRVEHPDAYRLVTLGIGLDGIAVPSPESFRLRERELVGAGVRAAPGATLPTAPLAPWVSV